MAEQKLWDIGHSYYCSDGRDQQRYDSWQDYMDEWSDVDMDYNLLFRWDFILDEDELYNPPLADNERVLKLFYMLQRKGHHISIEVRVSEADLPAIEAFLKPRWNHLKQLWQPITE